MKKTYFKQLSLETLIYGVSGMISKFINIFLVPIYTRIFTPGDYGIISIINTTMVFVSIFIVMGLDSAAHRWYWEKDEILFRKKTISSWFWFQFLFSLVFCLLFFIFSKQLSKFFFHNEENSIFFKIIALYYPFSVTNTIVNNLFRMQRKAWFCLWYNLSFSILNILLSILLVVFLKIGVKGVLYAQVISVLFNTLFSVFVLKNWISPFLFNSTLLKKMLVYSIPLVPASLAYWVINLSGSYFLNFFKNTEQVGIYQVGNTISSGIGLITGAFQQAIGPFSLSIKNEQQSKKIYSDILLFYILIISPICVLLNLFSYEILLFITNKNYIESYKVIPFLTYTYLAISLSYIGMIGSTIAMTTKPYAEAVTISAVIVIILYLILIPKFGIIGVAFSSLVSQIFIVIYIFLKSQKIYKIPYDFKNTFFIFILSFLISIFVLVIKFENYITSFFIRLILIFLFFCSLYLNKKTKSSIKFLIDAIYVNKNSV